MMMFRFITAFLTLYTASSATMVQQHDEETAQQQLPQQQGEGDHYHGATLHFLAPFGSNDDVAPVDGNVAAAMLGHYGKPPGDCASDEKAFQISGVPGMVCAPTCDASGKCPTDMPDGVTARPQCALENRSTGDKYCVLICSSSSLSSSSSSTKEYKDPTSLLFLRGNIGDMPSNLEDGQCGDASCQTVQAGLGICTWSV